MSEEESRAKPDGDRVPVDRVVLQAGWQGLIHKFERTFSPELAVTHYAMDKAVWDAAVEVRRLLVRQEYPEAVVVEKRRVELRNEFEAFGAIRTHCLQTGDRFELVPPGPDTDKWRAYFKKRPWVQPMDTFAIDMNPAVGVGSVDYIAIENLLRFVEGREPIND